MLAQDTPDDQWSSFEKEFEVLPPKIALPALFPKIAKGIPGGLLLRGVQLFRPDPWSEGPNWGEFCVVNWLWCKQLACLQRKAEVSKVLLELWSHPISFYGHMALLRGLCGDPDAESRIAKRFRDGAADERLRMEASVCLLYQNGAKYHSEVVAVADQAPIKLTQPGSVPYDIYLRQRLFDELVSLRHRRDSGVDPAVVRMGFSLLLDEAEQERKANQFGGKVSAYGQFIYADHLDSYLGAAFEPDRKQPVYAGNDGNETILA